VNVANGRKERLPGHDVWETGAGPVFGVITYIINDARIVEVYDCPVM
jgi:DNA polymerase V